MGQVDTQKLQKMVADLTARVANLEKYVKALQVTLAKNNIKARTL